MQKGLAIFYFFLGLQLQLPELAARLFLIKLEIDVSSLAAFEGTLAIPWCLKPVYGMISDKYKICSLRRKPYIILFNVVGSILWILLYYLRPTIWGTEIILVLCSISVCFTDVMYDSILVELAKKEGNDDHGKTQSICWASRAFGALVGAGLTGYMLTKVEPKKIFLMEAGIFMLVAICGYGLIKEKRLETPTILNFRRLIDAIKKPYLWRPAVFVFIFAATPSSYTAFFYFLVNELHFSPQFLGFLTVIRHVAMLGGTFIYSKCLRNVAYRKFFFVLVSFSAIMGASPIILVTHINSRLGLPNSLFAVGDDLFLSVIGPYSAHLYFGVTRSHFRVDSMTGQIALMPCLVLAAKLCPPGIEASLSVFFDLWMFWLRRYLIILVFFG